MPEIDLSLGALLPDILQDMRERSQKNIYRNDPEAWAWDVLGERFWGKQREFVWSYQENRRTAVKSANGTGKSRAVGVMISHWVTTHEPGEALAIITAPKLPTIRDVCFDYLMKFYGVAAKRKVAPFPGEIRPVLNDLSWVVKNDFGKYELMAVGLKPADGSDIVGSFQGRRRERTAVFMDEAGSLHPDIFTAAEAVTTGRGSRIVSIGNPDNRGTEFFKIFNDPEYGKDWEKFTISAFDLPSLTGEIVYKDDPARQREMVETGMPDEDWIDNKRRAWGEGSGRWKAKVLGEFPDEDDSAFFSQSAIDEAHGTEIDPDDDAEIILGCDVARGGQDESVVYVNIDGRIRRVESWSKSDHVANARNIHRIALEQGATEVRVDEGGTGSGTYDNLLLLEEFQQRAYDVVAVRSGQSSPNPNRWYMNRAWHYDQFRLGMASGKIDLDIKDKQLTDEMLTQTYEINERGAIQISSKKQMAKKGIKSPDYLDAAVFSFVDVFHPGYDEEETRTYESEEIAEMLAAYADDPWPY